MLLFPQQPAACRSAWTEVSALVPTHATVPPGGREFYARFVSISAKRLKSKIFLWISSQLWLTHLPVCCLVLFVASQPSVSSSVSLAAAVCDQMCAPAAADSLGRFARDGWENNRKNSKPFKVTLHFCHYFCFNKNAFFFSYQSPDIQNPTLRPQRTFNLHQYKTKGHNTLSSRPHSVWTLDLLKEESWREESLERETQETHILWVLLPQSVSRGQHKQTASWVIWKWIKMDKLQGGHCKLCQTKLSLCDGIIYFFSLFLHILTA